LPQRSEDGSAIVSVYCGPQVKPCRSGTRKRIRADPAAGNMIAAINPVTVARKRPHMRRTLKGACDTQ
jgi:hypothetical protein